MLCLTHNPCILIEKYCSTGNSQLINFKTKKNIGTIVPATEKNIDDFDSHTTHIIRITTHRL